MQIEEIEALKQEIQQEKENESELQKKLAKLRHQKNELEAQNQKLEGKK